VSLLEVSNLTARHGALTAVRDVTLELPEGSTLALVGANGAGKTTLLRAIAGAHKAASGVIRFDGHDITTLRANRRVALGIALVPEGRHLFADMTVEQNLRVAAGRGRAGTWSVDTVFDAFPLLRPLAKARASTLSGGEQQATAIGRALMANPRLLLLDEVSLGLAPVAVDLVYDTLAALLATRTVTVLLVEQDLRQAMAVADDIVCMLEGRVVLAGKSGELERDQITEAYFGLPRGAVA
jgi:branched-chain amino acid transport system ATP-binding protein